MADISLHFSSNAPLAGTYTAFKQIFGTWRRRSRERRELLDLDSRTIRELGTTPEAILFEAARFWWLVPLAVPALAAVLAVFVAAASWAAWWSSGVGQSSGLRPETRQEALPPGPPPKA